MKSRELFADLVALGPEARVEMANVFERTAEHLRELSVHLAGVNRWQAADELAQLERVYLDVARKLRKASTPPPHVFGTD